MPDITNIIPPRVPLTDPRTGLVAREWYRFFLSLQTQTGGSIVSLEDVQKSPSGEIATAEIAALQTQVDGLQIAPRPELGTMAALQQDNVPWLRFDNTPEGYPTGVAAAGTVYWDSADAKKTLNIVMEDTGNVIQQVGEETYYRVKATSDITNGQVVMFTGTVGASGGLKAAPATGLTATQNEYIMGVATQDIALNSWGYVTWFGEVRGINTTGGAEAWVDGQILYYNPAVPGGFTKNVPTAPNPKVIVASVVHAASNGTLFVRPTFGSVFGATDSNVQITSLANGDTIQYDSVLGYWKNVPPGPSGATTPIATKTTNYTITNADYTLLGDAASGAIVFALPAASTVTGRVFNIKKIDATANTVTIDPNGAETIDGSLTAVIYVQYVSLTIQSTGTGWVII